MIAQPIKLSLARRIANRIVLELWPFCERLEIAGSVRRARGLVNDIDLVVMPKAGAVPALKERCLVKGMVIKDGDENFICSLNGSLFCLKRNKDGQPTHPLYLPKRLQPFRL